MASTKSTSFSFGRLAAALLFVIAIGIGWQRWSGNDQPLGADGYEIAKALHAACNLQDARRLSAAEASLQQSTLSAGERGQLQSILEMAKAGRWKPALASSSDLLDSQ